MVFVQGFGQSGLQYDLVYRAITGSIRGMLEGLGARLPYILAGLIVLLLFWVLAKATKSIFLAVTRRTKMDTQLRLLVSRLIVMFLYVIGIFTALSVMIESFNFGQVVAGLGFTSFIVGFATKDILNNFLSGILILWQRPFNIGDYLFVGANQGKVEHIGVRATMLRKDDGEAVLIPNGEMYSSALTIRGAGKLRRMTLKFTLGFDSDLEGAKTVILETLEGIDGVTSDPKPNVLVTEYTGDGAMLTTQFWIDTNQDRPLRVFDEVSIKVLAALNAAGKRINEKTTPQAEESPSEPAINPSGSRAAEDL